MRLDIFLVTEGYFESRHQAKIAIKDGMVCVNGKTTSKPSHDVVPTDEITLGADINPYVSQGGRKLAHALKRFDLDMNGRTVIDIGASTGGFSDCALQAGARKIYAVDVGTLQMHPRLRSDARVILKENTNFLDTRAADFPDADLALMDVSFTSARPLLAHLFTLFEDIPIIVLIKPQFESIKTPKSGVIRDKKLHKLILETMLDFIETQKRHVTGLIASPIKGQSGNIEFLLYLGETKTEINIEKTVEEAHED